MNDANRQKITLSKALNEVTGDACVDSGEFTFNDLMEIRRRLMDKLSAAKAELATFLTAATLESAKLRHDIEAYRKALGYKTHWSHDGKLSDGTTPECESCKMIARDLANGKNSIPKAR